MVTRTQRWPAGTHEQGILPFFIQCELTECAHVVAGLAEVLVLALANSTEFGLSASVWSANQERAIQLAERLECGRAYVNTHRAVGVDLRNMPFGGVKQSGLGWEHGTYGLAEYIEYHAVNYARQA